MEFSAYQQIIADTLQAHSKELHDLCMEVHGNPELAFEEFQAVKKQVELLNRWSFNVECPVAGLDTAYKATLGEGDITFAFLAEYDALPGLGHCCGHNLICTSGLAAGLAAAAALQAGNIPGKIAVIGTPGEEGKGGKVVMVDNDAFNGVNAALISHPFSRTIADPGWLAVSGYKVTFHGRASHASVSPEYGINAQDAANLLFAGVNAWRQQLPEAARIHGIITRSGDSPNVIPDFAECRFYLRAQNEIDHQWMEKRFKKIVEGAALMTETEFKITSDRHKYQSSLYNQPLNVAFIEMAEELDMHPELVTGKGRGSSDFGNVSHILPAANLMFGICDEMEFPLHSVEFMRTAATDYAFEQTMKTARIMAGIAVRYFIDPVFRDAVNTDFSKRV